MGVSLGIAVEFIPKVYLIGLGSGGGGGVAVVGLPTYTLK